MLLNVIFRDIHEIIKAEFIEEVMTGVINGKKITEELMLMGAFILEIPIAMVFLSRVLKYEVNRWANIIVSLLTISLVISNGERDLDDLFFAIVEIAALLFIIWSAWKWQEQEA